MSNFQFYGKVIIIGDSDVGKTSISYKFLNKDSKVTETITAAFFTYIETIQGEVVKVDVWDTAGSDKFRDIIRRYYKGSCLAILLYDMTNRESFNNLENWRKVVLDEADEELQMIIVGNKNDLENKRVVKRREAETFCKKYGYSYFETSAKTGEKASHIIFKIGKGIIPMDKDSAILRSIIGKSSVQRSESIRKQNSIETNKCSCFKLCCCFVTKN